MADRPASPRARRRRIALSLLALAIVGAQVGASVARSTRTWPLVTFSMYSSSFEGPVEGSRVRVVERRASGASSVLRTRYGFSNYRFVNEILEPLGRGDEQVARQALDFLNAEQPGDRVLVLRADVERLALAPDGRFRHESHRIRYRAIYGGSGRIVRVEQQRLPWPGAAHRGDWIPASLRSPAPAPDHAP